ncbi:amidase domain-containing protein [Leifsonia xyli]|uniref:amidase domain-containing protein n=1 Tax=Leifsonia xyli TaxID=1575 RepID=UPI00146F98B9|nr:amidase domain-containing protein [Leifsonia xyli]
MLAHWEKYDSARYGDFSPVGGDCMNFVSAGLAEWFGSKSIRPDWYNSFAAWVAKHPGANPYNDPYGKLDPANQWVTPSWAYVPAFSTWLNTQKDTGITRTDLKNDPATWSDVKVGDVITMTWNDEGLKTTTWVLTVVATPGLSGSCNDRGPFKELFEGSTLFHAG